MSNECNDPNCHSRWHKKEPMKSFPDKAQTAEVNVILRGDGPRPFTPDLDKSIWEVLEATKCICFFMNKWDISFKVASIGLTPDKRVGLNTIIMKVSHAKLQFIYPTHPETPMDDLICIPLLGYVRNRLINDVVARSTSIADITKHREAQAFEMFLGLRCANALRELIQ